MPNPSEKRDPLGFIFMLSLLVTAVPMAVLAVPNTASYVAVQAIHDLGLPTIRAGDLVRADGLALPALILACPLAAVAARRLPAWTLLLAGLIGVLAGELAGEYANSIPLIGAVRLAEGLGAGAILPATLVLAWERRERRVLTCAWMGVLVAALVMAMPLAFLATPAPAPDGPRWRVILQPYPWLGGAALVITGIYGLLRMRGSQWQKMTAPRHTERTQLLLPVVPAAGFAFLAVVTTYGWSPGAQLIVAGLGLVGLLGLAVVGSRDAATGSPFGYAVIMLAVGVIAMPVTAPLAGLLSARTGVAALSIVPFVAGAAGALAVTPGTMAVREGAVRGSVLGGYGLGIVAVLLLLTTGSTTNQWILTVPLCMLGAGAALAGGAALRHTELGPALFGLSLCFPAVLTGFLVVGPLQIAKVDAVTRAGGGAGEALFALTAAFRMWLVAAGVIVVTLAAVTGWVGRGSIGRKDGAAFPPPHRAPSPPQGTG